MAIKEPVLRKKERRLCKTLHTEADNRIISEIAAGLGVCEITAGIIYDRGAKDIDSAKDFIGNCPTKFHDPFLMKDMEAAVDKISRAIDDGEKIVVYGDYDVDGVTSVSVLVTYLKRRGARDCGFYIPSREGEGYGLNPASVEKLSGEGYTLMITVDTGITALEEIELAKKLGLDTVVTDHHECMCDKNGRSVVPDVPCVNPRQTECTYPFDELAGVGVVFKLITALEMRLTGKELAEASGDLINEFGELVAVGTVADVMPLYGENRAIVKFGLEIIKDPKFIGMRELITLASGYDFTAENKKKISTSLISFTLAPRINAVGRMGNASDAALLFMTDDAEVAASRAYELCEMNLLRQKEETEILGEALERIEKGGCGDNVIVLDDDNWHHGVIGIVASRITEKYGLPSILISFDGNVGEKPLDSDIGKGSCRSIKGLDLVKALGECKDELVRYGGHELAAGLTVERGRLDLFRRKINAYAAENCPGESLVTDVCYDAEVKIPQLDERLISELYLLEPYGQSNPIPQFLICDLKITGKYPLKEGKFTKLILTDGKDFLTALCFKINYSEFEFEVGDVVDILGTAELNEYMGKKNVQIHLNDIRRAESLDKKIIRDNEAYNLALHGGVFPADMLPDREDFAQVYRFLRNNTKNETEFSYVNMCSGIGHYTGYPYIKLRAVLDIFNEMSLITYKNIDREKCLITLKQQTAKVDLQKSELLAAFKNKSVKH